MGPMRGSLPLKLHTHWEILKGMLLKCLRHKDLRELIYEYVGEIPRFVHIDVDMLMV